MKKESHYDKILLVLAAVAAIGMAGFFVWKSNQLPGELVIKKAQENHELGEMPNDKAEQAIKRLSTVFDWKAPLRNGKPVPLNKSILIVMKDDQLFDLFVEEPQFRPPMTNEYLVKHNLPHILYSNVGDLDPDGDGFSNLDEFLAGTNPMDPQSKPAATDKLFLKDRITNDYILKLNSSSLPVQVARIAPEPKGSKFVQPGDEFGFDKGVVRFRALGFERKMVPDPRVLEKDVSELKILDTATNQEHVLVRGEETNLAEYQAQFEFRMPPNVKEFTVKKGEKFQLPGTGQSFLVQEVEEEQAIIIPVDAQGGLGEPLEIKKR